MAIHQIFSVYDQKAIAYLQPFFANTEGIAVRMFTAAVNDTEHQFARFAEDYVLYKIGEFDDSTGLIEQTQNRIPVLTAQAAKEVMTNDD